MSASAHHTSLALADRKQKDKRSLVRETRELRAIHHSSNIDQRFRAKERAAVVESLLKGGEVGATVEIEKSSLEVEESLNRRADKTGAKPVAHAAEVLKAHRELVRDKDLGDRFVRITKRLNDMRDTVDPKSLAKLQAEIDGLRHLLRLTIRSTEFRNVLQSILRVAKTVVHGSIEGREETSTRSSKDFDDLDELLADRNKRDFSSIPEVGKLKIYKIDEKKHEKRRLISDQHWEAIVQELDQIFMSFHQHSEFRKGIDEIFSLSTLATSHIQKLQSRHTQLKHERRRETQVPKIKRKVLSAGKKTTEVEKFSVPKYVPSSTSIQTEAKDLLATFAGEKALNKLISTISELMDDFKENDSARRWFRKLGRHMRILSKTYSTNPETFGKGRRGRSEREGRSRREEEEEGSRASRLLEGGLGFGKEIAELARGGREGRSEGSRRGSLVSRGEERRVPEEAAEQLDRLRDFLEEGLDLAKGHKNQIDKALDRARIVVENVSNDQYVDRLRESLGVLTDDLFWKDVHGNRYFDTEAAGQIGTAIGEALRERFKYLGLPKISKVTPEASFTLEGVVITTKSVPIVKVHIESDSSIDPAVFVVPNSRAVRTRLLLTAEIKPISATARDIRFTYETRRFSEAGVIRKAKILNSNLTVEILMKPGAMTASGHEQRYVFESVRSRFHITTLELDFKKKTLSHRFLVPLATSLFKSRINAKLEKAISETLDRGLINLGERVTKILNETQNPLSISSITSMFSSAFP